MWARFPFLFLSSVQFFFSIVPVVIITAYVYYKEKWERKKKVGEHYSKCGRFCTPWLVPHRVVCRISFFFSLKKNDKKKRTLKLCLHSRTVPCLSPPSPQKKKERESRKAIFGGLYCTFFTPSSFFFENRWLFCIRLNLSPNVSQQCCCERKGKEEGGRARGDTVSISVFFFYFFPTKEAWAVKALCLSRFSKVFTVFLLFPFFLLFTLFLVFFFFFFSYIFALLVITGLHYLAAALHLFFFSLFFFFVTFFFFRFFCLTFGTSL